MKAKRIASFHQPHYKHHAHKKKYYYNCNTFNDCFYHVCSFPFLIRRGKEFYWKVMVPCLFFIFIYPLISICFSSFFSFSQYGVFFDSFKSTKYTESSFFITIPSSSSSLIDISYNFFFPIRVHWDN